MNMTQYASFTYADSASFNGSVTNQVVAPQEEDEYEQKLKAQLEAGEISQQQYNTLTHTNAERPDQLTFLPEMDEALGEPPQPEAPAYNIDVSYWTDQLDNSDVNYLMLK